MSISTPPSLDGMLVHRRATPWIKDTADLGGERHCESIVSYPKTQRNVPGQGLEPGPLGLETCAITTRRPRRFQNY